MLIDVAQMTHVDVGGEECLLPDGNYHLHQYCSVMSQLSTDKTFVQHLSLNYLKVLESNIL